MYVVYETKFFTYTIFTGGCFGKSFLKISHDKIYVRP